MAWYVSRRSVRLGERVFRVEGADPWNVYALEPGFLGEHARWWLELHAKYQRWPPWWSPRVFPKETITTLRWYDDRPPTAVEWLLARALAAWALWKSLRG